MTLANNGARRNVNVVRLRCRRGAGRTAPKLNEPDAGWFRTWNEVEPFWRRDTPYPSEPFRNPLRKLRMML
ncbi:hypothetical protein ACQR0Z_16840 [Bradyrhizobium sp. HKCCYLS3077]|uniref:hypothetical protein n=1 Tax=Bradyrhizobium sp. HKCCYLS3077 TaxID=3420761 RepID=UPI003EB85A3B